MIEPTSQQLLTYISRWDLRLRVTQIAIWLPRALCAGVVVGLAVALVSRLRPWLLAREVLTVSVVAIVVSLILTLLAVLIWPRPTMHKARYFDKLFGLKERNSTAIELSKGAIKAPDQIAQLQIRDAVIKAKAINARQYLPIRWRRNELIAALIMVAILALAVIIANPQNTILAQQQAFKGAITQQVQQLEQVKNGVQNNQALSDAEKAELNKILNDTINQLKEPDITQPEAVAALTSAEQQLSSAKTQLTPQQKASASQAAQALNQTQATQGIGQSLSAGDLNGAANQLQNLAQKAGAGQLTQDQMNDSANALSQAADSVTDMNIAAADAMKKAAEAMQQGDNAAAQKELNAAANALKQQQQKNDQSAQSQAANSAAQQANQSRQTLAQSSPTSGDSGQQQAGQDSNSNQQNGSSQTGQQDANQSGNPSSSQQGQQGQQGQQSNGSQLSSSQSGQQGASQAGQQGQAQNASSAGQNSQPGQLQAQQGDGSSAGTGSGQAGAAQNGQSAGTSSQTVQGQNGGGAGQGAGGAGENVTTGQSSSNNSQIDPNNGHGNGEVVPPENVYAPSFVGGTGGQVLKPNGDTSRNNGQDQIQTGDFANNPTGQSTVPITSVAEQASAQADRAMDTDHVPGALRGVVHDYFSGLQQQP